MLHNIFDLAQKNEKTPKHFSRKIVAPVYIKGDKFTLENYQAISQLSILSKKGRQGKKERQD